LKIRNRIAPVGRSQPCRSCHAKRTRSDARSARARLLSNRPSQPRNGAALREPAHGRLPLQMPEQSHKAVWIGQRHERDPRQRAGNVRVVIDAIL